MGRLVKIQPKQEDAEFVAETPGPQTQSYIEQVVKYIPAEIVGGYVAINGFLVSLPEHMVQNALWINLVFCAILTIAYLWKLAKPGDAKTQQLIISFISFLLWAYAITGDSGIFGKQGLDIYYSQLASVLLVAFSMVAPLFTPKE